MLTVFSLSTFATEGGQGPVLSQEARERILAKIVTAVEEETQGKCKEFRLTHGVSVADLDLTLTSLTECSSIRIKARLNGERQSMSKIKIDF